MFERFTDRARRVLVLAQEAARLLGHDFIGTEHLLLGLIDEGEGIAAHVLADLGVSHEAVRRQVEEIIGPRGSSAAAPPFTPRAKKVLELALREALQMGHGYIGTEHLLLGVVREGEGVAAQVLVRLGADPGRVRQQVMEVMSGHQPAPSPPPVLDLEGTMATLAVSRPLFHSERDVQLALAWRLHELLPNAQVRLEARPSPGVNIEILVVLGGVRTAVALGYRVDGFDGTAKGERYLLADQGAQASARYDFVKSVASCEELVRSGHADRAWAIALTNHSSYWSGTDEGDEREGSFALHEGRTLSGEVSWGAGGVIPPGREAPIELRGSYACTWRPYSAVTTDGGEHHELRYLGFTI